MDPARILIVEDSPAIAAKLEWTLEKFGYQSAGRAVSGKEAVAMALSAEPDLVLMDIELEGDMTGIQAAERLRAEGEFPLVYLTSHADDESLAQAQRTAPYAYLVKPFKDRELRAAIETALHRHRLEQRLKDRESALRRALKHEAVCTLAGGMAHEFNTVLSIILGNAEMAMEDVPSHWPVHKNLEQIRLASLRGRDAVRQLLVFMKKPEGGKPTLDPAAVLLESIRAIRPAIPAHIRLECRFAPDGGHVAGDPAQLHQVLRNLVDNAVRAVRDKAGGGRIEVALDRATVSETEMEGEDKGPASGDYYRLRVTDDGVGIPETDLERVFDPYFTTRETGEGVGMGLAVVYGIVRSHGGFVQIRSDPGEETAVEVFLPTVVPIVPAE
ncbi:MAG: sensor histidine kinase [Desulfococcaceae bacterium]